VFRFLVLAFAAIQAQSATDRGGPLSAPAIVGAAAPSSATSPEQRRSGFVCVSAEVWGQKRIQAELARLGFEVSARTVAKYMRTRHSRGPSPGWREFLKRHASGIWACDFFCVRTVLFRFTSSS
jgi:hypothetical protein